MGSPSIHTKLNITVFLAFLVFVFFNAKYALEQTQSLLGETKVDDGSPVLTIGNQRQRNQAKLRSALEQKVYSKEKEPIRSAALEANSVTLHTQNLEKAATLSNNITRENPVFVLSLPNSGSLTLDRYFKCAGLDEISLGRRWTRKHLDKPILQRVQIGTCIDKKLQRKRVHDPLVGCGNYRVWMELESSQRRSTKTGIRRCFFPVFRPQFLEQLFRAYPDATVINALKNPEDWYNSLPTVFKERWYEWCNERHDNVFPPANATKKAWLQVYEAHHSILRQQVQANPSVRYIEIKLDANHKENDQSTALQLQQMLGIPQSCWSNTARNPELKTDIGFPIFNLGLPKSATSTVHQYLNCGLGSMEGGHQWTLPKSVNDETPKITVAHCMQQNMQLGRPLVEGCGDTLHYSDIGVMRTESCFYPSMDSTWLETAYREYPYGTIINIVRNATSWYHSAQKWNKLTYRWSKNCGALGKENGGIGFPPIGANQDDWIAFYNQHTDRVRDFAKNHPSMTYVEVSLENNEQRQQALQNAFGFSSACWGHQNDNSDGSSLRKRYWNA